MRQRVTAGICGRAKLPYTMGQGTKKRKKKGLGWGVFHSLLQRHASNKVLPVGVILSF